MTDIQKEDLYNKVVSVTKDFLGPAAERFITRQIKTHLKKDPPELTSEDIASLTALIKSALASLTEDPQIINGFTEKMMKISKPELTSN